MSSFRALAFAAGELPGRIRVEAVRFHYLISVLPGPVQVPAHKVLLLRTLGLEALILRLQVFVAHADKRVRLDVPTRQPTAQPLRDQQLQRDSIAQKGTEKSCLPCFAAD